MPLKSGSSDEVVQENIKAILAHDGSAGYDPPYLDPSKDKYTPAQAAAIAYAKAGRRNNTGKYKGDPDKTYKAPKDDKLQDGNLKWWRMMGVKVPGVKPKDAEPETDEEIQAKKPKEPYVPTAPQKPLNPKVAWPKNQKPSEPKQPKQSQKQTPSKQKSNTQDKQPNKISPEEDKKMLKETLEGYQAEWGNYPAMIEEDWKGMSDKDKKTYHKQALKYKAKSDAKQAAKSAKKQKAPAPQDQNKPSQPSIQIPEGWSVKDKDTEGNDNQPSQNDSGPRFENGQLVVGGETFKPGKTLPGSTSPTLYTDSNGEGAYVVKEGGAKGQNNAEYAANKIYNALAPALGDGSKAVQSELVDGKLVNWFIDGNTIGSLNPNFYNKFEVKDKIKKALMADALLANWDYAGLDNDNIMVDFKGNLFRIDSGGTFNYRAQGEQKNYGSVPMEIWSLRNSGQGKQFWSDAKEEDYRDLWTRQAKGIFFTNLDKTIDSSGLDKKTINNFKRRKNVIAGTYALLDVKNYGNSSIIDLANKGQISWKDIDGAIEKVYKQYSSVDGDKDPKFLGDLSKGLKAEFDLLAKNASQQQPSQTASSKGINFNLADDKQKFNETKFKYEVDRANQQLNSTGIEDYGDPEPLKKLSDEGKYVLRAYSGSLYKPLNSYLRGTKTNSSNDQFLKEVVREMDAALASLPDGPKDTYWRMNTLSFSPERQEKIKEIKALKPGSVYSDDGYGSYMTEKAGSAMDDFYVSGKFAFVFKYEGSKLKKIAPISGIEEEHESLSERNQQFKVKEAKMESISSVPFPIYWGGNEKSTGKVLVITLTDP